MKSLVWFVAGSLLFGAAVFGAAGFLGGSEALAQASAAFALTFLPAAASLAWVLLSYRAAPDMRLLASLGGSGIRMPIALGGGYWLASSQPQIFDTIFWSCLTLFYLGLLAFEITLLVWRQPDAWDNPNLAANSHDRNEKP